MAIVFPDQGRILALDILLRNTTLAKIRLYKADITIDEATVIGSFTEADFNGYAAQDLVFAAPTINGDGQGEIELDDITFTHNSSADAGNTIYGWYITRADPASVEKLLFAEKFADSVLVEEDGDRVRFDLRLFDRLAGE